MKIILVEVLKRVLIEGRKEDALTRFPDFAIQIEELSKNDPSGTNKYLDWAVKQLINSQKSEKNISVEQMTAVLKQFHKRVNTLEKKDIFQYKTFEELADVLMKGGNSKREERKFEKGNAKTIYNDDRWLIVYPQNTAAACFYGKGTKWCTAAAKDNAFSGYITDNEFLFYVIDKTAENQSPMSKVALLFGVEINEDIDSENDYENERVTITSPQIFDARDETIEVSVLQAHLGQNFERFVEFMEDYARTTEETEEAKLLPRTKFAKVEQLHALWPRMAPNFTFLQNVCLNPNATDDLLIRAVQLKPFMFSFLSTRKNLSNDLLIALRDELAKDKTLWRNTHWDCKNISVLNLAIEFGQKEIETFDEATRPSHDGYTLEALADKLEELIRRRDKLS